MVVTTWLLEGVGMLVFVIAAWAIGRWLGVSPRGSGRLVGLAAVVATFVGPIVVASLRKLFHAAQRASQETVTLSPQPFANASHLLPRSARSWQ